MKYHQLTINNAKDLIFGSAPFPVKTRRGLIIGDGTVYPELNFTLSTMKVDTSTLKEIRKQYQGIIKDAIEHAIHLHSMGVIFEFETLIEMTKEPEIGIELIKSMNEICEEYYIRKGFKSEIRLTPNDLREFERPPRQRTSPLLNKMIELFDRGSEVGGDLLSIESTGGKEISDQALMMCDIKEFIYSQAVLGVRDMHMLWKNIVDIARRHNRIAGGDTACGFGNTAMVLAEKGYIPKIFAAVARVATIVRTLIAVEEGATGPDKDCGYEGPYLKAIAGIPISMEGKSSTCAHFSPLGNVAGACADLWSNESVQNIKLLAGYAPTSYLELLEYDSRMFNQAIKYGREHIHMLQEILVESDIHLDPQALVLAPENVINIAREIVKGRTYIEATVNGVRKALDLIEDSLNTGQLILSENEIPWISTIRNDLEHIPLEESEFTEMILPLFESNKIILSEYGL